MTSPESRPPSESESPGTAPRPGGTRMMAVAGVCALLAAGLGIGSRVRARNALKEVTTKDAAPIVSVITPAAGALAQELILPGGIEAFIEAPIYARASGYMKKWYIDIGARVKKGDRLADIDSPEIDQELAQARAQVGTAQANEDLAKTTYDRLAGLLKTDSVSKQDVDTAQGTYAARQADTKSAAANVRRLEQLVGFEKVEAPFDGVITARNTDVGQLIDAGSAGTGRELFRIASTDTLRVYIQVPEITARAAAPGVPVDITVAERPGRTFAGKVVRTANAIEPASRTLRVEVDLDNSKGELLPGAYAQVHLKLPEGISLPQLPVSALLFRSEGPRVATLGPDNRAVLVPVTIGRDFGSRIEIASGISTGTKVIDSPPDSLIDGQQVQVAAKKAATPAPPKR
jgi:RND family efflux transporter MFP subunit